MVEDVAVESQRDEFLAAAALWTAANAADELVSLVQIGRSELSLGQLGSVLGVNPRLGRNVAFRGHCSASSRRCVAHCRGVSRPGQPCGTEVANGDVPGFAVVLPVILNCERA